MKKLLSFILLLICLVPTVLSLPLSLDYSTKLVSLFRFNETSGNIIDITGNTTWTNVTVNITKTDYRIESEYTEYMMNNSYNTLSAGNPRGNYFKSTSLDGYRGITATDNYTISFFLKTPSLDYSVVSGTQWVFANAEDAANKGITLGFTKNVSYVWAGGSQSGALDVSDGCTELSADTWYHLAYTVNGSGITLYANGVFMCRDTSFTTTDATASTAYIFGDSAIYGGSGSDYVGLMDEIAIFYPSLTQTEVINVSTAYFTSGSINFDDCTLYHYPLLNLSFKDEDNSSTVSDDAVFFYNLSSFSPLIAAGKNQTATTNYNDIDSLTFCSSASDLVFSMYYNIYYDSDVYPQRRYYETITSEKQRNLYSLFGSNGISFVMRTLDQYSNPVSNVECVMAKLFSAYEDISKELSDDSGMITFFSNPDTTYQFVCSKQGYTTKTVFLKPTTAGIYNIQLEGETSTSYDSLDNGILYTFSPINVNLINNTEYNFMFNLTSSYWDLQNCTLLLKNSTQVFSQSSSTFNASLCNIMITANTGSNSTFTLQGIYEINNTETIVNSNVYVSFSVMDSYVGDFSLMNLFEDIGNLTGAGFGDFTKKIIALIVIMAVVGGLYYLGGPNVDPVLTSIVVTLLVFIFSIPGWLTVNYPSLENVSVGSFPLSQYILAILMVLITSGFLIQRFAGD